ncbi:unnamed protein product [Hermetia illucens]|uniref:Cytochrome P450 n=2 Tax=Hermetia illucens TaxID=343691 RepID=A0A7R8UFA1_HERIL|nr:unnamed protein product [Hermetia illucens]
MGFVTGLCYLVALTLVGVYALFKVKFRYWKKRGIPHFEPRIPYGTLFRNGNKEQHITENLTEIYEAFKGKTPFAGAYFFTQALPIAVDLDFIQYVLVKDFKLFNDRGIYYNPKYDPLSLNMFNVKGNHWKRLRTKLTPTFTSGKMKFMYPTIVEVATRFDQTLSEAVRMGSVIEIKELLARFTTDVIGTCAFGIECNSLKDPNAEFRRMGRKFFAEPPLRTFGRTLVNQFPKLSIELGIKTTSTEVSSFFMGIVKETLEYREKNNIRRDDFMDLLIQLKRSSTADNEFSVVDVAAQAFLFFLAGFETSSTTMTFALYELALDTEIQDKARNEINEVLKKHNGKFTYEAMMDMKYLDCIINETLRKHPPVVVLMRVAEEDYPVPGTDKIVEKGQRIFIPAYSIHHDPDIYPNPEVFDPSRFEPEEIKKRHPMSFLGFGDGPRNCIGARFGQMQTRIGLVTLLRSYRFTPCNKTLIPMKYSRVFVLSPEGGMYLNVEKIN